MARIRRSGTEEGRDRVGAPTLQLWEESYFVPPLAPDMQIGGSRPAAMSGRGICPPSATFGALLDGFPFGKEHGGLGRRQKIDFPRTRKLLSTLDPRTRNPQTQAGEIGLREGVSTSSQHQ